MLSLHFNGDVIRHPDSAGNYARRIARYDSQRRCKYGIRETQCPVYLKWVQEYGNSVFDVPSRANHETPRCTLCAKMREIRTPEGELKEIAICPERRKLQERGNIEKKFRITNKHYRQIASAGHLMMKSAKNKAVFFTLTFPKFKRDVTDAELNTYFSKFMENLRSKNYNLNAYIAVREHGEIGGRTHYHVLADMPFISYSTLNDVWCRTISFICNYSTNALTTDKRKSLIYDFAGALRYVCKYVSKARGQESDSRMIFIGGIELFKKVEYVDPQTGEIIVKKESTIKTELSGSWEELLPEYKGVRIKHDDFITVFTIMNRDEFKRFCQDVIYPYFGHSINKPPPLRVGSLDLFRS